ncbi:MAG TPA: HDIG domain-containing protein [Opitutaceae bacterium]|nr:HDIG domain-containing protein [Opitutaceae bacterium]
MSVRNQLRLLVGGTGAGRGDATPAGSGFRDFLDRSRLVAGLIFIVTVAAIVIISSARMRVLDLPVLPNQVSPVRIVAGVPFTYVSTERTRADQAQRLSGLPPIYRLDMAPLQRFEEAARVLLAKLTDFEAAHPGVSTLFFDRRKPLAALADEFNARGPYETSADDLAALLTAGDAGARGALFESGFAALRQIYSQGINDSVASGGAPGSVVMYEIERPTGGVASRPVESMEDALTFLRVSLAADGVPKPAAQALFRLFRGGVQANLVFDREAAAVREAAVLSKLKPVKVRVPLGKTIVEAGDRVSGEQYEMATAYRMAAIEGGTSELDDGLELFGRVLLVMAMVLASILYVRLEDPETLASNVRLGLLALVVILNLALVRIVYSVGGAELFLRDSTLASALPYLAPTALAPLIVAILIDAGSAIFMALFISIFTGVIYGNRLDLLVLTFLASMVAVFGCRDVRRRGRVVAAAGMGGLTVAAFASLIGIAQQTPVDTLAWQMAAGLFTGLLTGVAVVGFLPVLEALFKRTTDITLLELTDFNHPLLRRMQMEAPGTYHHSLVVAQLSENACNAIGANPLLARACSLFHDIGKAANPAFFTENQRETANPHDDKDPAASAAIIRQHVADGVELAARHHLPRAVIDVIRQHHGTTLVRFFYERALAMSQSPFPGVEPPAVPDEPFRYEGPKPQFKESAVVSLADGVEAVTRSVRTITAEKLASLIDRLVTDRVADGQLDEAPITFEDLAKIKNSFTFTLLNMLHSRVAYSPAGEPPTEAKA